MKRLYPFISNSKDDRHCAQAAMAMILTYENKSTTIRQLDHLMKIKPKQLVWNIEIMHATSKLGISGVLIEAFDYRRFGKEGTKYLSAIWIPSVVHWEVTRTNVQRLQRMAKKFQWVERPSTAQDIRRYFTNHHVLAVVNARSLNGQRGYSSHVVLVTGMTKNTITFHDPGLPPKPNRKVSWSKFKQAYQGCTMVWKIRKD